MNNFHSQKHPAPTGSSSGSGSWLLVKFAKIFFSPQTSKVKRQKNIKIIVFLIIKTYYFTRVQFTYAFYLLAGLRSRLIFTGSSSWLFFQAAPAPCFFSSGSGSKEPKTPGSGSPALVLSVLLCTICAICSTLFCTYYLYYLYYYVLSVLSVLLNTKCTICTIMYYLYYLYYYVLCVLSVLSVLLCTMCTVCTIYTTWESVGFWQRAGFFKGFQLSVILSSEITKQG